MKMGFVSRGLVMVAMVVAIFAAGNRESSAAERRGDHCVAVDTGDGCHHGTVACRGPVCRVFAARPVQRIVEAQPVRRAFAARPIRRLLARAPVRNFLFRRCH